MVDEPGAGLGVQALAVAGLADRHRRGDMDQQEVAHLADHAAHLRAGRLVRGDRRADRDATMPCHLGGHVPDARDVQITVGPGEAEPRGQELADQVAVEQRHRPVPALGQGVAQRPGDRRLAGAGQPGEEHDHAALPARRAGPAQFGGHPGRRVPRGHVLAAVEQILQLARGQVGLLGARLDERKRAPHLGRPVVGPFTTGHHRDRRLDVGCHRGPAATVGVPFVHEQVSGTVGGGDDGADRSLAGHCGVPGRQRHRDENGARWHGKLPIHSR